MHVLGGILAGGIGRRFGSDKALALLAGEPLIAHAVRALTPHVARIVVCGRDHGGLRSLDDRPAPGLGPLGAINAALHEAAAAGMAGVLTMPCDMPLFPAHIACELIGDGAAVVARQPLLGYWPATLAPMLDDHIDPDGDRSVRGWMRRAGAREIVLDSGALPNINTPADLASLEAQWPG